MSAATHSPAPWQSGNLTGFVRDARKDPVACVYGSYGNPNCDATMCANVALIRAAPDLLAALKGLLEECDINGSFAEVGYEFPSVKPVFDAARAAIAKAEGRS